MQCFQCKTDSASFTHHDSNGVEIWRCSQCGHDQKVVRCSVCQTFTVSLAAITPRKVEVWRCSQCGDSKHWCPCCDQGWVLPRGRSYVCDECDATWSSDEEIGRHDTHAA